jgi:hypothetical protein
MLRIKLFLAALLLAPTGHGTGLPAPSTKPELQVLRIDKPNSVKVTLSSASQGSTRIWSAGNSWGAANWRVYIVRGTNLFLFREDPDQRFSRNSPKFEELKGVKHISLDFSTKFWIGPSWAENRIWSILPWR